MLLVRSHAPPPGGPWRTRRDVREVAIVVVRRGRPPYPAEIDPRLPRGAGASQVEIGEGQHELGIDVDRVRLVAGAGDRLDQAPEVCEVQWVAPPDEPRGGGGAPVVVVDVGVGQRLRGDLEERGSRGR